MVLPKYSLFFQLHFPQNYFSIFLNEGDTITEEGSSKTEVTSATSIQHIYDKIDISDDVTVFSHERVGNFIRNTPASLNSNDNPVKIPIYYYKKAIEEHDYHYAFLNFITCLESMFSDSQELTEKLSRRTAVIISSDFDKQETFENMKNYYSTRSNITHGDKTPQVTQLIISNLSAYVRVALRNYLILLDHYGKKKDPDQST